jgi:hypothetical protein
MDSKTLRRTIASVLAFATLSFPVTSLDDIAVGAKYRMTLSTGDVLEGTVDSKNDTSLILDCNGNAYTFTPALITEYQLLAPPRPKQAVQQSQSQVASEGTAIPYAELKNRRGEELFLEVKITSGSLFKGKLLSIDETNLRLDVEGSPIPIAQNIIGTITIVPAPKPADNAPKMEAPPEVLDTLIVKNPESDEYGKRKDDMTVAGKIIKEDKTSVTIVTAGNQPQTFTFDQVIRTIRHTTENPEEEQIKTYAKSLFCQSDMVLVDLPPGKKNRPFFKFCIDKYEYPNKEGTNPQTGVSWADAQKWCEQSGKRLCTAEEWQWACSGREGYVYPYGIVFEKENCNTDGDKRIEPSGNRNRCISKFGVMDMSGNVFEWVRGKGNSPAAMGGPLSKCQTVSPGASGDPKPTIGLRCCKSN